jgi:hypothetical protein
MTTSSTFPNKETFIYRQEFCFVLQKISKICTNPVQRPVFEKKIHWDPLGCKDVLEMNNTFKVCDDNDRANASIANRNPRLVEFLFDYASKNLAVLNLFIRDPYYTSYLKTEQISHINFIGNAGGLLGLCMGLSFVSVFEVFYHFVNNCWAAFDDNGCSGKKGKVIEIRE